MRNKKQWKGLKLDTHINRDVFLYFFIVFWTIRHRASSITNEQRNAQNLLPDWFPDLIIAQSIRRMRAQCDLLHRAFLRAHQLTLFVLALVELAWSALGWTVKLGVAFCWWRGCSLLGKVELGMEVLSATFDWTSDCLVPNTPYQNHFITMHHLTFVLDGVLCWQLK